MSDTYQLLYELERGFWTGGPEFYLANADDQCLVCFPGMVRLLDREALAQTVASGSRWRDVEIVPKAEAQPSPSVLIIAYEASARRGEGERYAAAVSSGYVLRDGKWKLAWHQQTPL